ncbi:hypothetical protein HF086_003177 [Spodoptera exigua]|uniref:DDE Tnp4 domain-containing protein n=1 Tax=Spodoptera exigua TaxID=7107 RepID=A0A922MFD1_SPOEX|nr:hypothetical protein HF086_003177 [Spodoptera exigua]
MSKRSPSLLYLARGSSFVDLEEDYLIGASTIRSIVKETCTAIWQLCKNACFPAFNEERWLEIASEFYRKTQFPNCLGAVDGKHIRLKMPPNSGSNYFNYKSYFSTVLMAVVDADYCFTFIDVGAYGKHSDSNIFKNSNLEKGISSGSIPLPNNHNLPNDENGNPMPFVFVGDEAFAVSNHVMRPYPDRNLSPKQRIFNYRLSRARRIVENAFGILSNKWAIFQRSLNVDMKFAITIIKAACTLHNFVRKRDGIHFEDTLYSCTFEVYLQLV